MEFYSSLVAGTKSPAPAMPVLGKQQRLGILHMPLKVADTFLGKF